MQIKENFYLCFLLCGRVEYKKALDKCPHFSVAIHVRNSLGVSMWKRWFL